jgi:cellulose biosynthesis protein BcsQ
MEPLAVVGASSIIESIKIIRKLLKHKITLLGIVPTFVSKQSNVAKQVLQMIHTNYDSVLPQIRSSVRVKEASGSFMTINEYDAKNGIIEDLQSLVDRVMDGQKV